MAAAGTRAIRSIASIQGIVPEVCAGAVILAGAAGLAAGAGTAQGLIALIGGAGLGALLWQRRRRTRELVRRLERQVAERTGALEAVVRGAATQVGDDFFRKLVEHLALALGARYVCVGELEGDGPARVRAFAVWDSGHSEPIEHDLANTPCLDVIQSAAALCINGRLIERYPQDEWLLPLKAEAYCGAPIQSRSGDVIGLVSVIASRPFESEDLARSLVSIFAQRAGAEMERTWMIAQLTKSSDRWQRSEQRLRMAMAAAGEGLWDWNLVTGETFYSDSWYAMLGFAPGELPMDASTWESLCHPDDLAPSYEELYRHARGEAARYVREQRLRTKSGAWKWVLDIGEVVERDADGAPLRAVGVHIDIDEQKRAQAELSAAREAAEAASQAKTEFLANMSHEIRTPMTAILGYADLLAAPDQDPADRAEFAAIIRRNGEHLLGILSDILDVSRIEAGMLRIELVDISPAQVVEDVCRLLDSSASAKGLRLTRCWRPPLPRTVRTDPGRLRQILSNLIGNALKFTERGGVTVTASLERGLLRVSVKDTGIGIDPDQIESLFAPFSQGDPSVTRRFGGTGLGLTISRNLARTLGGDITATSRPAEGSDFTLTLPAAADDLLMTEDEIREAIRRPAQMPGAAPAGAPTSPHSTDRRLQARILLAEDGPDNQRLIRHHLEAAGASVQVVENGRLAVEAVAADQGRRFDLVLMDMQMPEIDGYTAAAELRRRGYAGPIVALTAHAMAGDRERCLEAGCDDYLAKPIERRELLAMCERWMQAGRAAA